MTEISIIGRESIRKFGRIGFIKIADDDGNMVQYGGMGVSYDGNSTYDIKFEVEKFGTYYATFNVSILGLSSDTINSLVEWDEYEAYKRHRVVEVYAGYFIVRNGKRIPSVSCIARGFILRSIATNPPERWLNMTCLKCLEDKDPVNPTTEKNLTVDDIFDVICTLNDRKADTSRLPDDLKNKVVESYTFEGSKSGLFDKFQNDFKVRLKDDGTTVFAISSTEYKDEPPDNARYVSVDSGLMDSINIDQSGIELRHRLDTDFDVFEWINVLSTVNPKYNGYYYIISMKYKGHLRGKEWFVDLSTQRYIPKEASK